MKIVLTGGGSGGHITPALAVAHELKKINTKIRITYIGQTGDSLGDIPTQDKNVDEVVTVRAGKLRRYHGEGLKQLLDVGTLYKNLRDTIWVFVGIWQSFWLLKKLKPAVIFTRGSFVSVPVCLAAVVLRIPYITHDSDAIPSLANRIIGRWARVHAVALPKDVYAYPAKKTVTVGVPISHTFRPVSVTEVATLRKQLGLERAEKVLLVTGGGLGAQRLNAAVVSCMPELLLRYPDLFVVHIAGRFDEEAVRQQYKVDLAKKEQHRVLVRGFITNLYQYSAAADVIVTRAGGTAMAEFAAQAKPIVVVPNPLLTGGHQLKNAQVLADRKAVRLVKEDVLQKDHRALMPALTDLLDHPQVAKALGAKLGTMARPDSAHELAMVLLDVANTPKHTNKHV